LDLLWGLRRTAGDEGYWEGVGAEEIVVEGAVMRVSGRLLP
jgi:hypothetical protein